MLWFIPEFFPMSSYEMLFYSIFSVPNGKFTTKIESRIGCASGEHHLILFHLISPENPKQPLHLSVIFDQQLQKQISTFTRDKLLIFCSICTISFSQISESFSFIMPHFTSHNLRIIFQKIKVWMPIRTIKFF